ncbi:MAG TPA: type I-E CRISPR-associated protein Cse2/CasB, partial [Candidatus Elarobacter sp.]|nr:type I-E CRISPR-associated protein Cse2/CasB [Candidatus Elarobacter sp.]
HVRQHTSERPMQLAGWKSFPSDRENDAANRPRLSEARFRRLLQVEGREEQVAAFVRLIALTDSTMNVSAIGTDFLRWGDERTRQRWAFDYYAAGIATPQDNTTTTPSEDADA